MIYPEENPRPSEQILSRRRPHFAVSLGNLCAPQNFSHSQPYHQRHVRRSSSWKPTEYSDTCITARCALEFRRVGKRQQQELLGSEQADQTGAKLVATWEDVWEDLHTEVRLALTRPASPESSGDSSASLFSDEGLPPHEKRILSLLPTKPRILTKLSSAWRTTCRLPKSSLLSSNWNWPATSDKCRKNFAKGFQLRAASWKRLHWKIEGIRQTAEGMAKAHGMTLDTYRGTAAFPRGEMYGLTSQLRRATASMGANTEGCGRRSDGEMCRFLQIARGSASETEYHFLRAKAPHLRAEEDNRNLSGRPTKCSAS